MIRQTLTDARLALRSLLKQPRFVIIATATLALGIGLVTAIFSVVNGVLLRPLPYPQSDRLVNIWSNAPGLGYDQFGLSPDIYYFFRAEAKAFDDIAMFRQRSVNLVGSGDPEVIQGRETTHSYLSTLGIAPRAGSGYAEAHDQPGAPLAILISSRLWQRKFSSAPGAVGQAVQIDGAPATIVGVMPAWLDETDSPDVWMPARLNAKEPPVGNFGWFVSARLRAGVAVADAETGLVPLVKRLLDEKVSAPDYRNFITNGRYRAMVHTMKEDLIGDVEQPLWILLGTVGFVLLIACANVANLCLIRADGRRREIAVRSALGAPRSVLVRQQLVEALVLALIGGAAGVLLAAVAIPALISLAPSDIPRLSEVRLDPLVLLVAAGVSMLSAIVFGLVPAVRYTRAVTQSALRQDGRGTTADRARHRGRKLLVIVQTAMTLILLVGSGLLGRSFARMIGTDLGFRTERILTFRVTLPRSAYADSAAVIAFDQRLRDKLTDLPGVESVGAASQLPVLSNAPGTAHVIEDKPVEPGQLPPMIHYVFATPGYFETMGMRLIQGRTLERRDTAPDSRDVVINRVVADRFWPAQNPLGKRLRTSGTGPDGQPVWFTVAGVVAPVLQDGVRREPPALIYYPSGSLMADGGARAMSYVLRGRTLPDATAVRKAVWSIDAALPLAVVQSMDEIVKRSFVQFTFTMLTLGIAALTALILGAVGLYGVLSYAVSLRVREIGVRLALGAPPGQVMRSIVLQGVAVAGIGLVIGLAGAYGLTRLLGSLLYQTEALDVTTFAAMSAALFAVALLAAYLPARRAAGVSPLESLRSE